MSRVFIILAAFVIVTVVAVDVATRPSKTYPDLSLTSRIDK